MAHSLKKDLSEYSERSFFTVYYGGGLSQTEAELGTAAVAFCGHFAAVQLDADVIAKIVDKINYASFVPGKDITAKGNSYEMTFYDRHAKLIDKIIMVSDREILYGRDDANGNGKLNYITIMRISLGYDYIDRLYRQANPDR